MSINPSNPYNYKSVQPTQMVSVANRKSSPVPTVARQPAQVPKKKSSFSWPLALAGVATLLVGLGVVGFQKNRAKQIRELPQLLETIFRKPYTPEETKAMVTTYQDLLKIEDKKTFIEQAFQQIKTDMGLEDVNVRLEIVKEFKRDTKSEVKGFGDTLGDASFSRVRIVSDLSKETINNSEVKDPKLFTMLIEKVRSHEQKKLLGVISHELQHIRQYREMLKAGFVDEFIKSTYQKQLKKAFNEEEIAKEKVSRLIANHKEIEAQISSIYGDVRKSTIQKGTPRYQKAEEYLIANKSYNHTTYESYRNNLLEVEAFEVEDAMKRFVRTIKLYI